MDGTQKEVVTGIDGFAYDFFAGKKGLSKTPAFNSSAKAERFLTNFAGAADSNGKGLRPLGVHPSQMNPKLQEGARRPHNREITKIAAMK